MSIFELLFLNRDYLFYLKSLGIKIEDSNFLDLFIEYVKMKRDNQKITYIVAFLADKYKISIRKVYQIIRKMQQDCTIDAV